MTRLQRSLKAWDWARGRAEDSGKERTRRRRRRGRRSLRKRFSLLRKECEREKAILEALTEKWTDGKSRRSRKVNDKVDSEFGVSSVYLLRGDYCTRINLRP